MIRAASTSIFALGLAVAIAACHAAATDPRLQFREATGGDAWRGVRFVETEARVSVGGLTGTIVTIEDAERGWHKTTTHLGPVTGADGVDDKGSWELTPNGEVVVADAAEARAVAATGMWMTKRGYWTAAGATYVDRGTRSEGGAAYRVVEATPAGGAMIELWFDAATGLLARTRDREGANTVVTTFGDYRDVGGVRMPFHSVIDSGDPRNLVTVDVVAIRRPATLADGAFVRPSTDDRLTLAASPSEVPFELINNHIYIQATVDGKPVRMIVDTGGLNLLVPAAAARLGLHAEGKLATTGTGAEKVDRALAHATTLEVGAAKMTDPVFYVLDMGALHDVEGEPFDGLVGFELFQRLVVRIDYPARKLVLAKRDGFTPPAGATAVPFELRDRTPIVAGSIDGLAARFTIDTGARNSVTANSPFVRAHDLEKKYAPKFEAVTGWGVGGGVRGKPVRFRRIALGSVAIDDVAGDLFTGTAGAHADPDVSANLGGGILHRFIVTFDYGAKTMYLERAATNFDEDRAYDRAGMFFLLAGDALRIVDVTPNSPAARAGLAADDRIVAIDQQPIAARRLAQWRALLTAGTVGARHVLTTERAGTRRDLTLVLAETLP